MNSAKLLKAFVFVFAIFTFTSNAKTFKLMMAVLSQILFTAATKNENCFRPKFSLFTNLDICVPVQAS